MAEPRRPGRISRPGVRTLLLALLLPALVALLAVDSWNDHHAVSRIVQDAYDQALLEPVQALDDSVARGPDGSIRVDAAFSVLSMFEVTRARNKYLHVGITSADGTQETLVGEADLPPAPPSADGVPVFYDATYHDHAVRIATIRRTLHGPGASVFQVVSQAAESIGPRQQAETESLRQALWSGARLVGVIVIVVWLGVALTLRPLGRLRRSLQARAPGDLQPLDASGVPNEVVPLVEAVNHHIADHRRMLAEQSRFLADASHQLRTPLAIMLTQAGYAMREQDVGRMRESLQAIVVQLARARRLSEQLLALAQASQGIGPGVHAQGAAPEVVDLNTVARNVVLQYLPLAHEKNQDLGWADARGDAADADDTAATPVAPVRASEAELHEALSNLLDNAIAYTPRGGRITVSVAVEPDRVSALVSDTGPGIPPERRARAFERFQRGGTSEAGIPAPRGAGLGLAIALAYARRNGGDIALSDGAPNELGGTGLSAALRLPNAR